MKKNDAPTLKETYQRLRELLVTITVENDDKEKLVNLLNQKCERKREELTRVEAECSQNYENLANSEEHSFKGNLDALMKEVNLLSEEKKRLLNSCQELVYKLKSLEAGMQTSLQSVYDEGEQLLEMEQKQFRMNQEERMQKFLSAKSAEIRESTNRAMVPEFHRLESLTEKELAQLESRRESQEREIRNEYTLKYQRYLEQRKSEITDRIENHRRDLIRKQKNELAEVELECRRIKESIQYDGGKEIESLQLQLSKRNEKERRTGRNEVIAVQEEINKRLGEEEVRHNQEMVSIKKDHDHQVKSLLSAAKELKDKLVQSNIGTSSCTDGHYSEYDNKLIQSIETSLNVPSSKLNVSSSSTNNNSNTRDTISTDNDNNDSGNSSYNIYSNSSSNSRPSSPTNGKKSFRRQSQKQQQQQSFDFNTASNHYDDEELNEVIQIIKSQRDELLKQEIKTLQEKSYQLEKVEQQQYDKNKQSIISAAEDEEKELLRKIKRSKDDVAELVVNKEKLLVLCNNTKHLYNELENRVSLHTKETISLQNELNELQHRKQDIEYEYQQLESTRIKTEKDIEKQQLQRITDLTQQIAVAKSAFEMKKDEIQNNHRLHLESLDTQVKSRLASQDVETIKLKEDIETERLKIDKLNSLLAQYSSSSSSSSSSSAAAMVNIENTGASIGRSGSSGQSGTYNTIQNKRLSSTMSASSATTSRNPKSSSATAASTTSATTTTSPRAISSGRSRQPLSKTIGSVSPSPRYDSKNNS